MTTHSIEEIALLVDGVEIGVNSCVDRGKFSATIIGDSCTMALPSGPDRA